MPNGSLSLVTVGREDRRGPTTTDDFLQYHLGFGVIFELNAFEVHSFMSTFHHSGEGGSAGPKVFMKNVYCTTFETISIFNYL